MAIASAFKAQRQHDQHDARGGGVGVELRLRARHPVENLHRHDRELAVEPLGG